MQPRLSTTIHTTNLSTTNFPLQRDRHFHFAVSMQIRSKICAAQILQLVSGIAWPLPSVRQLIVLLEATKKKNTPLVRMKLLLNYGELLSKKVTLP
jgi:hypothetical protein